MDARLENKSEICKKIIGKYGEKMINIGETFLEFCIVNNLIIANKIYHHVDKRKLNNRLYRA